MTTKNFLKEVKKDLLKTRAKIDAYQASVNMSSFEGTNYISVINNTMLRLIKIYHECHNISDNKYNLQGCLENAIFLNGPNINPVLIDFERPHLEDYCWIVRTDLALNILSYHLHHDVDAFYPSDHQLKLVKHFREKGIGYVVFEFTHSLLATNIVPLQTNLLYIIISRVINVIDKLLKNRSIHGKPLNKDKSNTFKVEKRTQQYISSILPLLGKKQKKLLDNMMTNTIIGKKAILTSIRRVYKKCGLMCDEYEKQGRSNNLAESGGGYASGPGDYGNPGKLSSDFAEAINESSLPLKDWDSNDYVMFYEDKNIVTPIPDLNKQTNLNIVNSALIQSELGRIKMLLDSNISTSDIEKNSKVDHSIISKLRHGGRKISSLTASTALHLNDFFLKTESFKKHIDIAIQIEQTVAKKESKALGFANPILISSLKSLKNGDNLLPF